MSAGGRGPTFTQWQKLTPYQIGDPSTPQAAPQLPTFYRNIIDRRLSGTDQTPEAQYPDGYLGTVTDRREARKYGRITQRNYQRGVDKGSRIDPADYEWPDNFDPLDGIRAEARGLRHAPLVSEAGGPPFVNASIRQGQWLPRGAEGLLTVDPQRRANFERLAPPWR